MRDPNDDSPHAPADAPESPDTAEQLREGLRTAQEVAEGVQRAAGAIQQAVEGGGPPGELTPEGVLGGVGAATGGAAQAARELGADPAVAQVLGVASQASALAGALYEAGEAIVEAVESILDGEDAHIVRFGFVSDADPVNAESTWVVRSVDWTEKLGELYRARIELLNEDLDARPEDLVGSKSTLTVTRGPVSRKLHGIVDRVEVGQASNRYVTTTVELVPALAYLAQRVDSRVFQEKTSEDILKEVFAPLKTLGRELELHLNRSEPYPVREYCTQYEESDLAFFRRVLESEGLTFYFDQTGDAEKVVVVDHNGFDPAPTMDGAAAIPFVPTEQEVARAEPIRQLVRAKRTTSTSVVLSDHDWTKPAAGTTPRGEVRGTDEHDRDREVYVTANPLTHHEFSGEPGAYDANDLDAQKRLHHELLVRDAIALRGRGVVTGFAPGFRFDVERNPNAGLDGHYYLVEVHHRGTSFEHRDTAGGSSGGSGGTDENYSNTFTCLLMDVPYRPERSTPKPRIAGILSAVVVGPDGQEFWTDQHRRVKVQFPWDRLGKHNDRSSCFLRVQQPWAGPDYGFSFLPRIGMEVVVAFVGGDPDRPVVTGCIHNGHNAPPYTQDADIPRNTIKTCSTDRQSHGGSRYNELAFYDENESELIALRAQKDLREDVLHDHSTRVHRHQSNTVDANQTETVGGDQQMTVRGERRATVEKNEHLEVLKGQTLRVVADREVHVEQNQRLVTDGERHVFVNKADNETFNGGREVIVKNSDTLRVREASQYVYIDQEQHLTVGQNIQVDVAEGGSLMRMDRSISFRAAEAIELSVGTSRLVIDTNGFQLVSESGEGAIAAGATSVALKPDGQLEANAPAGFTIACAGNTISGTPAGGITINGVKLAMSATGMCDLRGAIVRIN